MKASDPGRVIELIQKFSGDDLTSKISQIENLVLGITNEDCSAFLINAGAAKEVLAAAAVMKGLAGQINVTIHALGILLCLPYILDEGEKVEYVSLGAGNTGREFDLETNRRIAEFKFICWQGGSEAIRQNSIFKDFFLLARAAKQKEKYLYVLGVEHPLKFLKGGRALKSVLSKNEKVRQLFFDQYRETYSKVAEYYRDHKDMVHIVDVSEWLPELVSGVIEDATADQE